MRSRMAVTGLVTVMAAGALVSTVALAQLPVQGGDGPPARISEAELVQRLRVCADSLAKADRFSGVILLKNGARTVFEGAYGYADREAKRRNDVSTEFNYSSIGKLFTQAAIWQLVDDGKIALDSTVGRYLPDYPNKAVASGVTVRELLNHRSGIGGDLFAVPASGKRSDVRSTADYVALFANEPMHFAPGTREEYSNAGYILLGAIIERVTGEDYYTYVQQHVLDPAGLSHTHFYFYDSLPQRAAIGYTRGSEDAPPDAPVRRNSDMVPGRGSAAGGGYSTVEDLARFVTALREAKIPGLHGVRHGAIAGGSPGSNGIVEENLPGGFDIVVLSNFDPPAAMSIAGVVHNWLLGRPTDAPMPMGPGRRTIAAGQAPSAVAGPFSFPATAAGRAAEAYYHAYNAGEPAMRDLLVRMFVPNPARPIEQRLASYNDMHSNVGTLTPLSVAASTDNEISIVTATGGGGQVTVTIAVEPAAQHRISAVRMEAD